MKQDYKTSVFPNVALTWAGGIELFKLKRACRKPRKSAESTLRKILAYAKDTVYGKEHNFEKILQAKSDFELFRLYQENVPANNYEDLRPYVERHKQGEENLLFPGKPVMYATTSGTTKEPKWIPITDIYLKSVYDKMTKLWLHNYSKLRIQAFSGSILAIVGNVQENKLDDGTIYGSVSGLTRRDCPDFIKKRYVCPTEVYEIKDYTARYYTIMRMGIEHNVTLLVTANPSTILEMQSNADRFYDQYIEDIEKGTLWSEMDISPEIRAAIAPYLKPNPKRAHELRKLKKKYGTPLPKHYWPDLQLLNTWKNGNTKVYVDKFKDWFPKHTLHQELGYFSSECRFGLVLDKSADTVLFPHMHYYEFVDAEDLDNPTPRFYQLNELQSGKRYCPFVTTFAGLYRYNMNDLIEVGQPFENTPTVQLIQKVNGIISMTGEKLHECHFIKAVHAAEKDLDMPVLFFVGFADVENSCYHFYYEFADSGVTQADAEAFTQKVDEVLKRINMEYDAKRASFRVKDPITHRLQPDSFEHFKQESLEQGARDGQFKVNLLMQDEKRHAIFKKLILD